MTGKTYRLVHHPGATLKKETNYCLVARGGDNVSWDYTSSNDEDSGGAAGWAISNVGGSRTRGTTSSFVVTTGTAYQLRVDGIIASTPPWPPYPSPPFSLTFTGIAGGFKASWSTPLSESTDVAIEPITKYQYRHYESNKSPYTAPAFARWRDVPGGSGARSVTVTGLEPTVQGMILWVEVRAVNSVGAGTSARKWGQALPLASGGQELVNTPADGFAGITGSGTVGETFTATTTDITDVDGMTDPVFTYQWKRGELGGSDEDAVNIATGQSYTLTSDDEGKEVWVVVSFTDDADNAESVPSNKYIISPAIEEQQGDDGSAAECESEEGLFAEFPDWPRTHDGETPFTFDLCFTQEPARGLSFRTIRDYLFEVTEGTIDRVQRLERGSGKRWRVTVDPAGDADVVVVQKPTISNCESWRAVCTPDGAKLSGSESFTVKGPASQQPANSVATGEPEIDGTLRVGSTLTATTSNIEDADGMTGAVFTYQWQRIDTGGNDTEGEDITAATGQTYVVTSDDVDRALRVVVSFTDDADNAESVPSPATETVTDAPPAHTDRPYNLRAVVQDGAVVLTWEEPDITRNHADDYRIYRHRPELGEPETLVYVDFTADITDTYTDTGVAPGVLYVYRVQAVIDFFGNLGEISDPVEIRIPGQPQEQQTDEEQTDEQVYDFDAGDGQRVLAGARIRVGERGRKNNEDQDRAWYATDTTDWHASGELLDGALTWNGMTVNRVVYFPDTDVFRLNDPRDGFDLGASFQEGGVNRELTIWVQTATDKVSFLARDHIVNSGGHWINFRVPEAIRTVLDGIAAGDEITIAVSVPE